MEVKNPSTGDIMEFKEIVQKRYATKEFDGKTIPQEKIDELLELIKLAPSSFGLQPFQVKVISDQETKEKLVAASFNQKQITTCSHLLVFCSYANVAERIDDYESMLEAAGAPKESYSAYIDMMRGFLSNLPQERIPIWGAKQAYIALGNAMNGATSLGFDSCPMEGFDPEQYKKILGLPEGVDPVVICPIGYGVDTPHPKLRYPDEKLFI